METAQEIKGVWFRRVPWNDEIQQRLLIACRGAEQELGRQVREGSARCWEINQGESYMVTHIDGLELVIMAYQGLKVRQVMLVVFEEAQRQGLRNIRFHTCWSRLIDIFRDFKPEPLEYVVRIPCGRI